MRVIETNIYTYAELSDDAKAKARDWYRNASAGDNYFAEYLTDDMHDALRAFGFSVADRSLQWSGFWSQGDGASFSGSWYASDLDAVKFLRDRPAAWTDENGTQHENADNAELWRIAQELSACKAAGLADANIHDSHFGFFMSLDNANFSGEADTSNARSIEKRFIEAARDLASWFYHGLEAEYEYQNSDEVVAEAIAINGYEFTEDGKRA